MAEQEDHEDQATSLGLTPIEHAAWNLFYNMVEAGIVPSESDWWFHEFRHLKQALEARGLNTDPSKTSDTD